MWHGWTDCSGGLYVRTWEVFLRPALMETLGIRMGALLDGTACRRRGNETWSGRCYKQPDDRLVVWFTVGHKWYKTQKGIVIVQGGKLADLVSNEVINISIRGQRNEGNEWMNVEVPVVTSVFPSHEVATQVHQTHGQRDVRLRAGHIGEEARRWAVSRLRCQTCFSCDRQRVGVGPGALVAVRRGSRLSPFKYFFVHKSSQRLFA